MNPRSTGILFLLAVLIGAFIYLYEIRGGEEEQANVSRQKRLFPDLEGDDIELISLLSSDGQRVVAERRGDGWALTAPVEFAADDVALEAIAGQLAQLEVEGRLDAAPRLSDFGLDDLASAVRFRTDETEHVLLIGRRTPVGSNIYIKLQSNPGVAFVASWRIHALGKSTAELRDRRLLVFDHVSTSELDVSWPEGHVALEKRAGEWWITEPVDEVADQETVETLLSDLAFLRADAFLDVVSDEAMRALDRPRLGIAIRGGSAGGSRFELELKLGAELDGQLVARGMGPSLQLVSPQRLEDFPRELIAYRFKQLARFEVSDARRFELAFHPEDSGAGPTVRIEGQLVNGRWVTTPISMDAAKVRALMAELARLEATQIIAEAAGEAEREALGLEPPRVAIRVFDAQQAPLGEVAFGVVRDDRGWLAQRVGAAAIYLLDPQLKGQIPESLEALEADFIERTELIEEATLEPHSQENRE
jgi:hypothetical protein